ncbi:MAG: PH domain-containing protein [Bdellovibrionales bacterium]|nr:PH domain-containing protein [Bdellovibrionales bacterium]
MATAPSEIVVPRSWRSEVVSFGVFFVLSLLSIFLSKVFPWSVIEGELFKLGNGSAVILRLPMFWFLPAITIGSAIYRTYNVRYVLQPKGIECEIGILALQRRVVRLWFEDIRTVQVDQTLLERFLDIGSVHIGTAATSGIEITLSGVAAPHEVQEMIQRERDKRQKSQRFEKKAQNISEESISVNS